MTGLLVVPEPTHQCDLPPIRVHGPERTELGVPSLHLMCPEGTRFHCDCGKVYVSTFVRARYAGGGLRWRPETRGQRRKRLGLRWWQCRTV